MSPILTGVIASGISGHLTPPWSPEGAYDALATVSLSTTASSITFSGIPNNYKHLQIRGIARCNFSADILDTYWTFNGTSSGYYAMHQIRGNGSTAASATDASTTDARVFVVPGSTVTSNMFGSAVVDILDYTSSKNKTIRSLTGVERNGSGDIWLRSSLWMNSSPINSITINAEAGSSFIANSHFALYGVK